MKRIMKPMATLKPGTILNDRDVYIKIKEFYLNKYYRCVVLDDELEETENYIIFTPRELICWGVYEEGEDDVLQE